MALEAFEFAPEDFISIMPDNVVTNILDRLPIQEAVKTSILSRNWRFKWTKLSQLVFDYNFFEYLSKTQVKDNIGRIISSLLLSLKGPITKFVLYIDHGLYYSILDDEDIAQWILFLSRKGVEDLTITKMLGPRLKLPTHIFSCSELKHLKLFYCCFGSPASFRGFPNLLSLELGLVQFESSKFGDIISQCPVLEILNTRYQRLLIDILNSSYRYRTDPLDSMCMDIYSVGKVKLDDFAKLANLKILSLSLCHLDKTMITNVNSISKLVGLLPKLQELDLEFAKCKFTKDGAKESPPTAFSCLKVLKLLRIDLSNDMMLSCAFDVIRSFPNLQTLEITASDLDIDPTPEISPPDVDYNTMGLMQLQSVAFTYFKGSENEVCLIKCLLACSPFLKKFVICPGLLVDLMAHDKFMFARKLLKLYRASPRVDVDLKESFTYLVA